MRRRYVAAMLGTASGCCFKAMEQKCHAENIVPLPLTQEVAPVKVSVRNSLKGVVHMMRVVFRGAYLVYYVFVPLLWAALLHTISERMVSKSTLHLLILQMFKTSGPCFLKLGQWAATRPDLFGKDFCVVVGNLHTDAPTHSWANTKKRIEESFGSDEMFEYIDEKPLHSGCIAQVHKAKLRGSNQELVVKVMHPDVEESVDIDLSLLGMGARAFAAVLPGSQWLSLVESCDEFTNLMRSQLDFKLEASNLQRFVRAFKDVGNVHFPVPIAPYVSYSVLTETFEEGCSLTEYQQDDVSQVDKQKIATIGCHAFFKMVFDDNLFHADLHPGNILVNKKNGIFSLTFLDAGLVSTLNKTDQKNFMELFAAVCSGEGRLAGDLILKGAKYDSCIDPEAFKNGMQDIISNVNTSLRRSFCLADVHIGELLFDTMDVVRNNQVKLDPAFTTLVLSIALLEGIGRSLWPELNLFKVSIPYILPHVELSDVHHLGPIITNLYQ